jgi:hypothetical protein
MSALEQVPRGSGSQLRNLRLRWDSDSKQIISFWVFDIFFLGNHVAVYLSLPHLDDSLRRLIITDSLHNP